MLDPIKRVAAAAAGIIVVASEEAHFLLAQVFPYKNRTVFRAKKGGIVKRWAERGFPF